MQVDRDLFREFYQSHSRPLWLYLYKACRDEQLAEDILQESFLKYIRANPCHLNSRQQKAYLYKIATHLFIDLQRKSKTEEQAIERMEKNETSADHHAGLEIEELFQLLKPKERSLLWLVYVEGYTHLEISKITGFKTRSVKVILYRLKKKLAEKLAGNNNRGNIQHEKVL